MDEFPSLVVGHVTFLFFFNTYPDLQSPKIMGIVPNAWPLATRQDHDVRRRRGGTAAGRGSEECGDQQGPCGADPLWRVI